MVARNVSMSGGCTTDSVTILNKMWRIITALASLACCFVLPFSCKEDSNLNCKECVTTIYRDTNLISGDTQVLCGEVVKGYCKKDFNYKTIVKCK